MLRIGICDDEELITKRLMRILYSLEKNQSENYDIEVYTDSVKLSEKLSAGKRYDLIFLFNFSLSPPVLHIYMNICVVSLR